MKKKVLAILLAGIMCFSSAVPVMAEPEENAEVIIDADGVISVSGETAFIDGEELFALYVDKLFGLTDEEEALHSANLGAKFTGNTKLLYEYLCKACAEIASGKRSSSDFTIAFGLSDTTSIGNVIDAALNAVLSDHPEIMYWFGNSWGCSGNPYSGLYSVALTVSADYSVSGGTGTYDVDTSKTGAARRAIDNAQRIIADAASKSDYEKLDYYRQWICDNNTYNSYAANNKIPYGDPWQIVYVFDEDNNTNVVCEGYAKAFQYLCDKTEFISSKIYCMTVSGVGYNPGGGGGHMWNIMHMDDGKNYHTDITWCDPTNPYIDNYNNPNKDFFLVGALRKDSGVYYIDNSHVYQFDADTMNQYTSEQLDVVSGARYNPAFVPEPATVTVDYLGSNLDVSGKLKSLLYFDFSRLSGSDLSGGYISVDTDYKYVPISSLEHVGSEYILKLETGLRNLDKKNRITIYGSNGEIIPIGSNNSMVYTVNDIIHASEAVAMDERMHGLYRILGTVGESSKMYFNGETHSEFAANLNGIIGAANASKIVNDAASVNLSMLAPYQKMVTGSVNGLNYEGSSLVFNSETDQKISSENSGDISIRHYFTVDAGHYIWEYTFRIDGFIFYCSDIPDKNGVYYIEIGNIPPAKYDDALTLTVATRTNTLNVKYSVNSYFYDVLQKSYNSNLIEYARYLYLLGKCANEVF